MSQRQAGKAGAVTLKRSHVRFESHSFRPGSPAKSCVLKYLELLQSINYKCVRKMERGVSGPLQAADDPPPPIIAPRSEHPRFHFSGPVPSVCCLCPLRARRVNNY